MKFFQILIAVSFSITANAQINGIYIGESESKPSYISSKTLVLNSDNTFIIVEKHVSLEMELPQETIKTVKGRFNKIIGGIAIFPEKTGIQYVSYTRPIKEPDVDDVGIRITAPISSDTSELMTIKSDATSIFRLYKKPNSYYLCGVDSNHVFMKFLETESSNDLTFYLDEVKSKHRLESSINDYERRYRTNLNYSDTLLIESQIDSIKNDCKKFKRYLQSKHYSGEYIKTLAARIIESKSCPLEIFESSFYFFQHEKSIRPYEVLNYPIRSLLKDKEEVRNMFHLLMNENNVVCESNYLESITDVNELQNVKHLLNQYQNYINDLDGKEMSKCEIEIIDNLEKNK